jgi:hypothetical protein
MKIHEEKNNSRNKKATCGYCREGGHNQYQCPHVKGDWENFLSRLEIPKDKDGKPIKRGYNYVSWHSDSFDPLKDNILNNSLASWFRNCRKAYIVQKERGFNANYKAKRSTNASRTCGFCGSKDHTRRSCSKMKQFLEDCYKANENWRKAAYKELVKEGGLSVGAAVRVSTKIGYNSSKTSIGIIKSINWDTINVFTGCHKLSDAARSPLVVEVLVDGQTKTISNLECHFNCIGKNGNLWSWESCELVSVITHSPTPLPPEWITSYKESFSTLAKKRSYEQLQNGAKSEWNPANLVAHIEAWR